MNQLVSVIIHWCKFDKRVDFTLFITEIIMNSLLNSFFCLLIYLPFLSVNIVKCENHLTGFLTTKQDDLCFQLDFKGVSIKSPEVCCQVTWSVSSFLQMWMSPLSGELVGVSISLALSPRGVRIGRRQWALCQHWDSEKISSDSSPALALYPQSAT